MNDRVNKKMPYDKEGVVIHSKLDELMMQYYRVPNGEDGGALHIEAFEVGQKLQKFFVVYSSVMINEAVPGKKMTLPDQEFAMDGIEAPLTLMLDNIFFQNNYQVILAVVLAELTRMNTAREIGSTDQAIMYSLSLCKWEYLSVIAGLVNGSKAQRDMDISLRKTIVSNMDEVMKQMKQMSAAFSKIKGS